MEKQKLLITSPDSVEIHDVTIAIAQANLAISAAKQISDSCLELMKLQKLKLLHLIRISYQFKMRTEKIQIQKLAEFW